MKSALTETGRSKPAQPLKKRQESITEETLDLTNERRNHKNWNEQKYRQLQKYKHKKLQKN